jgi:hypothetical protein
MAGRRLSKASRAMLKRRVATGKWKEGRETSVVPVFKTNTTECPFKIFKTIRKKNYAK